MAAKKKKKKAATARPAAKKKRVAKKRRSVAELVREAVRPVLEDSGLVGTLSGPVLNLASPLTVETGPPWDPQHRVLNPAERVALMAAAPDLYQACRVALDFLENCKFSPEAQVVLRAALNKAQRGK